MQPVLYTTATRATLSFTRSRGKGENDSRRSLTVFNSGASGPARRSAWVAGNRCQPPDRKADGIAIGRGPIQASDFG